MRNVTNRLLVIDASGQYSVAVVLDCCVLGKGSKAGSSLSYAPAFEIYPCRLAIHLSVVL
jgi:hypothetical protein